MRTSKVELKLNREYAKTPARGQHKRIIQYLEQQNGKALKRHDEVIVISEEEERTLEICKKVFSFQIAHVPRKEIEDTLKDEYGISDTNIYYYFKATAKIFKSIRQIEKEFVRIQQVARRERKIEFIEERLKKHENSQEDYSLDDDTILAYEKIIEQHYQGIERITKLDKEDEMNIEELAEQLHLPETIISSDEAILDIPHEDAE